MHDTPPPRVGSISERCSPTSSPPLFRQAVELAESQWGVIAAGQLRALGVGDRTVGDWLQAGRLRPLHHGVHAVGHRVLRVEGRWLAAVLACGPGAVLSHQDAAALWGIRPSSTPTIHVSAARSRHHRPGLRVHRPRRLAPEDVTKRDGIPVTSVARTLLDLAAVLSPGDLESLVATADRQRVLDAVALESILARGYGHRGRGRLARVLIGEPKMTRQGLARRFLELVREAGLPEPEVEVPFTLGGGEDWRLDVLWRAQKVSVELDDWTTHRTRARFEQDRERAARMTAAGHHHFQFTWRHVTREARWVIDTLRPLVARRRR